MDGSENHNNHAFSSADACNDPIEFAESDFITLSDIMPLENEVEAVEVPNSFDDMILDGEVLETPVLQDMTLVGETVSSNTDNIHIDVEIHSDIANTELKPDIEITSDLDIGINNLENSTTTQEDPNHTEKFIKKVNKRGRKKKVPLSEEISLNPLPAKNLNIDRSIGENGNQPNIPRKRGRPPKKKIGRPPKIKEDVPNVKEDVPKVKEDIPKVKQDVPKVKKVKQYVPKVKKVKEHTINHELLKHDDDDDDDDICLSTLKKDTNNVLTAPVLDTDDFQTEPFKIPILSDFDCNVDKVIATTSSIVVETLGDAEVKNLPSWNKVDTKAIKSTPDNDDKDNSNNNDSVQDITNTSANVDVSTGDNSLLVENGSKRPSRRTAKRNTKYKYDSDEDPFANVSSDDDKPKKLKRGKKSNRYNSDDEYVPDNASEKKISSEDDIESDFELDPFSGKKQKKVKSPGKRKRATKGSTSQEEPSELKITNVVGADDTSNPSDPLEPKFSTSNKAFENFLAERMKGTSLQIKKVSSTKKTQSTLIDIPMMDINEQKKTYEKDTQTTIIKTKEAMVQTSAPYALKLKNNKTFTQDQSEEACKFLKNMLTTTSELGKLMTDKSDEFIAKKINTKNVQNIVKMDYCIKKAFLLFKLAKDNLTSMEENLEKQYEEFINQNNLKEAFDIEKKIIPKATKPDSDSDVEIIEEPVQKPKAKAFNPKTVFLNKELSIKIAKTNKSQTSPANAKAQKKETSIIKEKNLIWKNEGIVLKKVKTQKSFLAQDGRNKKPPDYVTEKMVKDFFHKYHVEQVQKVLMQYTSPNWLKLEKPQEIICGYFDIDIDSLPLVNGASPSLLEVQRPAITSYEVETSPKKLLTLCMEALKQIKPNTSIYEANTEKSETLFQLCSYKIMNILNGSLLISNGSINSDKNFQKTEYTVPELKTLCFKKICTILQTKPTDEPSLSDWLLPENADNIEYEIFRTNTYQETKSKRYENTESLQQIVLKNINMVLKENSCDFNSNYDFTISDSKPKNLRGSAQVKKLTELCFAAVSLHFTSGHTIDNIKEHSSISNINIVQKLSELALAAVTKNFNSESPKMNSHVLPSIMSIDTVNTMSEEAFHSIHISQDPNSNSEEENGYDEDDYSYENFNNDDEINAETATDNSWASQVQLEELKSGILMNTNEKETEQQHFEEPSAIKIKSEVIEASEPIIEVKKEPEEYHNSMVMIPEFDVTTKSEYMTHMDDQIGDENHAAARRSKSFDMDHFESFASNNKLIRGLCNEHLDSEIFSQSASRVRRQHDPDSDNEFTGENDMGLLIPQESEDFHIETAKGSLMASSSDEGNKQKSTDKKKKRQGKKVAKAPPGKNKPDEEITPDYFDNISALTKKMKVKLVNESNKSSDSETEDMSLLPTKRKRGRPLKNKKKIESTNAPVEIQCNNVDSTQQLETALKNSSGNSINEDFTGFSNVDQNEIAKYQKYVNFVYDKIISKENEMNTAANEPQDGKCSPLLMTNEPVELLECEPSIEILEKDKRLRKEISLREKEPELVNNMPDQTFVDRHGWKCYPVDLSDTKLSISIPYIGLQKLPEDFVNVYFKLQNIQSKSKEDLEIDRLANLNSLHRSGNSNEDRSKTNKIRKDKNDAQKDRTNATGGVSPADSDHYNELSPSEDEDTYVDPGSLPPVNKQIVDNCLAKNDLLGESDTEVAEDGTVIKKEKIDNSEKLNKSLKIKVADHPKSLVLTADKMMRKELDLLHAPVTLDDDEREEKHSPPKTVAKSGESRKSKRERKRNVDQKEDNSSSEEEKQWVNTKSKLLKRIEKKGETTASDDAKRAKLVSEFIERRNDVAAPKAYKRGPRRSMKKFLEKEKQLRVLSKELYGDSAQTAGKSYANYSKGRKNIRKVIDKKSLQKRTVLANMEEFERKRRLNQRQARLRELLGYDESINVVVIDDEVCLEYDFEAKRPVVTIHPFFTKVMKEHQYEGVKFMWDACFESLEMVESGHPGGGCILAHCMGLGKTLQVLALLHAVLTQPRAKMARVLVCCPLSTVLNWVDEIHKWLGPVTDQIKVFELSKLKKTYERAYQLEDWFKGGGIFIIGYELFRSLSTLDPELDDVRPKFIDKIRTALLDPGPDIIVCDEGHLLKNDSSVLAVAMSRVVTKRRIVLTGTPMQNNLREYYCMVNFIKPSLLGTYPEYSNRFENPIMNGQHRDSREEDIRLMKARTHILHKVLEGCLQRQEASVMYPYLPKKHEYTIFISLSPVQTDLYRHYLDNYAGSSAKVAKNNQILKDFHLLQKIWSHPRVLHNFQKRLRANPDQNVKVEMDDLAREDLAACEDVKPADAETWWLQRLDGGRELDDLASSTKFLVVFKILKECVELGDKLLIFSTSLYTMDVLEYFLQKINQWSIGQEYYRLDGSVPPEVRQKWCREFNAEHNTKTKLFLISTRAGSLGLNMTAANRVIILDTSWNPAHDIQSIFRVYRFGQKKDCFIYRLVAMGTMEQKIYERAVTKQAVSCRVVDEQQIDRHYNMAELTELYRFDVEGVGVAGGVALGVRDVVLLRVARDTPALHAAHEHDSLLRDTREQDLPAHERDAAWTQFEQEHRHTQMQQNKPSVAKPVKKSHNFQGRGQQCPVRITSGQSDQPETSNRKKRDQSPEKESLATAAPEMYLKIKEALQFALSNQPPEYLAKLVKVTASYVPETAGSSAAESVLPETTKTITTRSKKSSDANNSLPETKKTKVYKKKSLVAKVKEEIKPIEKPSPVIESIELSDDEDGPPPSAEKKDPVPLSATLIKNKNFIKIVAHTYLKGNPMLDEDAAMLAAEYSTTKVIKEMELTGKPVTEGPIYDIAIQVLGENVLLKLHEADKVKSASEPKQMVDVNPTTSALAAQSFSTPTNNTQVQQVTPTDISPPKVTLKVKTQQSLIEPKRPKAINTKLKPGPYGKGKANNSSTAMQPVPTPSNIQPVPMPSNIQPVPMPSNIQPVPMPSNIQPVPMPSNIITASEYEAMRSRTSDVRPVELIRNTGHSMFPPEEESILPDDDDDVRILSEPLPPQPPPPQPPPPTGTEKSPKLIYVMKASSTATQETPTLINMQATGPASTILHTKSDGTTTKLTPINVRSLPANARIVSAPQPVPVAPGPPALPHARPAAAATAQPSATICIDSDEEDAPAPPSVVPVPVPQPQPFIINNTLAANSSAMSSMYLISSSMLNQLTQSSNIIQLPNNPAVPTATTTTSTHQIVLNKSLQPVAANIIESQKSATKAGPASSKINKAKPPAKIIIEREIIRMASKTGPVPKNIKTIIKKVPSKLPPKINRRILRGSSSSSSSSGSGVGSPAPADPLAVLQNVVHIPADYFDTQPTPPPQPPQPPSAKKPAAAQNKTDTKASEPTKKNADASPTKKTINSTVNTYSTVSKAIDKVKQNKSLTLNKSKVVDSVDLTAWKNAKTKDAKKTSGKFLGSIDLTDTPAATPPTKHKSASTSFTKKTVESVEKKTKPPAASVKASTSKRKQTLPPPTPTKKAKPMPTRLEDFTLDDMEDIIELE